ncbi:MAG: pyridoxal phosphate-dependent aminotransferase [Bryobacteraceae bacterium]
MSLSRITDTLLERGFTRRRLATMLTAGAALPFFNEFTMAQDADRRVNRGRRELPPDAVRISSNENPLGPCKEGLEAMAKIGPYGGRYSPFGEQRQFVTAVAQSEDVKEEYVAPFAGSSDPLFRTSCAFTSSESSWVMADPGYGGGAPKFIGSKLVRVPLRADHSHDVEAMIKADPNAGVYYVCNPNNPSGTLTSRQDIEYLLANKKKDAIVLVDEAYIHFSTKAQRSTDLVAADKDVIILRTFSKVYGMAGIRAGFAMGRPDLLERLHPYGIGMLPITGLACATASLQVKPLVAERREINRRIREDVFNFLEWKRASYILSETNFFMVEVNRPAGEFAKAMAAEKVFVGRTWPAWPTKSRVTVGTQDDMNKFKAAFEKVMA